MSIENGLITIAMQKSGRLNEKTIKLFNDCDIDVPQGGRQDFSYSNKFPIKFLFLRNGDIPTVVNRGFADLGVAGQDGVYESGYPLVEAMPLGYGGCNVALGVREDFPYSEPKDLEGLAIATSFPRLTTEFFRSNSVNVDIFELGGSVELAANQDWVKACVDVTSSGESMRVNGLDIKRILMPSEAELVASPLLQKRRGTETTVMDLVSRLLAVTRAQQNRFIAINAPSDKVDEIIEIAKKAGSTSPNSTFSANPNIVEIQAMIRSKNFWETSQLIHLAGGREIAELSVVRSLPNPDDPQLNSIRKMIYG